MRTVRTVIPLAIAAIAALFIGCSGGRSVLGVRFKGTITREDPLKSLVPFPGILVTVVETGESDVTREDGYFDIQTTLYASELTLRFQGEGFENSVPIGEFPDSAEVVEIIARYDEAARQISVDKVLIQPGDQSLVTTTTTTTTTTFLPGATPIDPNDPNVPLGPFDEDGNTSSFGIPSGTTGNISRGEKVWRSICSDCHGREKRGASYGDVRRAAREQPEMRALDLSSQKIADVVAYLNRSKR